ncbi:hypothetical protein [Rubritalea marina]|uniref:hypothetical protein n=1 Tax=Rubritalea marina TaxID=361055 RepID=UPI00036B4EAD|nr:hypothetical protein [Rubritalea marina]
MKTSKFVKGSCALLLLLGCSTMLGEALSNKALKGFGLASQIAPYTKVFGIAHSYEQQQAFETFACSFTLEYTLPNGERSALELSPEVYSKLRGPYNRRNVYGALLAYGPALSPELRARGLQQALLSSHAIIDELGIPEGSTDFQLTIRSKNPKLNHSNYLLTP